MTATDELRRLLDERGVEWWQKKRHTCWKVSKGQEVEMWRAWEAPDGSLTLKVDYIYGITPKQAIAATLGTGTCHIVKTWSDSDYVDGWRYRCSECGCFIPVNERDPETGDVISAANYCPNCGRRCVG